MASEPADTSPNKESVAISVEAKPKKLGLAGRLARPLTVRAEARRQKIFIEAVAAARSIALAEGIEGLTARRIARTIGCSVGTLYNVFDNLDTLILQVNGETFDSLYEELLDLELPANADEAVRLVIATYLDFVQRNVNLWNVVFEHVWPTDYPIPDWYLDKTRRLLAFLAEAMMPLFPPKKKEQALQTAIVLWSGLHGIYSLAGAGKLGIITGETVDALTTELIANTLAGLKSRNE